LRLSLRLDRPRRAATNHSDPFQMLPDTLIRYGALELAPHQSSQQLGRPTRTRKPEFMRRLNDR
jgi:hypothetical protein